MGFIGSGRHRRPTQTERAVAAAGVAGAGIALPLLTATGAHAVAPTTWDAVAQCASAGNWAKDTGNGAYGGLQIDLRSWVAYGGDAYAAEPDHATREQQIAVAERILEDRGASVWGSCATSAGLTGEGRAPAQQAAPAPSAPATADTPSTPAEAPAATADSVQRGSAAPVFPGMQGRDASGLYWYQMNGTWYWTTSQQVYEQATGTATGRPSDPTGAPAQGTTAPAPTTTHPPPPPPGAPAAGTTGTTAAPTTGTPAAGDPTGTTAAPTGDPAGAAGTTAGTPATPAAPAAADTPAPAATPAPATYTVAPGDTLSAISDSHKLGGWKHLYDQNQSTVGEDPDMIHPGQVLNLH